MAPKTFLEGSSVLLEADLLVLRALGCSWGALGGFLGPPWGPKRGQKSSAFTDARKTRGFLAKKK